MSKGLMNSFFEKNSKTNESLYHSIAEKTYKNAKSSMDILNSGLPWLKLKGFSFPLSSFLSEIQKIRKYFHYRNYEGHKNWESICLYGLDGQSINPLDYINRDSINYIWTEYIQENSHIKIWLEQLFFTSKLYLTRVMNLRSGGYILPHSDYRKNKLLLLHLVVTTNPVCYFMFDGFGRCPLQAGDIVLINGSYTHSVLNSGNKDRIHIVIHGKRKTESQSFFNLLQKSVSDILK